MFSFPFAIRMAMIQPKQQFLMYPCFQWKMTYVEMNGHNSAKVKDKKPPIDFSKRDLVPT